MLSQNDNFKFSYKRNISFKIKIYIIMLYKVKYAKYAKICW